MKVAILHDSFTQLGGAERVVDVLHEMFPGASVYTLVFDEKFREQYKDWEIRTSWLNSIYKILPRLKLLFPLIPFAISSLDLREFDLVVSSSSGFIRNIKLKPGARHIQYCHTPPRFLWIDKDYVSQETPFFIRPVVRLFLQWMKKWDLRGVLGISEFIANSEEVKKRIKNIYRRESVVIYPGISDFWKKTKEKENYFLLAGRLQPHKNNEMVVKLFTELNLPLHVAGTGRQESYLKSIAGESIKFLGRLSDAGLRDEYSGAVAYIYPQIEDFGLMPLEAAGCGTPTIAFGKGGVLETVLPGKTGEFFQTPPELKSIVQNWQWEKYKHQDLVAQAGNFDTKIFQGKIFDYISRD